jgi:hypothetical protein
MKLLFDENLSFRLVEAITQLFPGSIHITRTSLARGASDRAIWEYAGQNDFVIVTADSDFVTLANTLGHPPKVIHLAVPPTFPPSNSAAAQPTNSLSPAVILLRRQRERERFNRFRCNQAIMNLPLAADPSHRQRITEN